jgi:putative glycosyltransferase (TIGR04348 family)
MNIFLVTPAPPRSRKGNRQTAVRWAGFLRELGHRVKVAESWHGETCDLMIALHARRSHDSIRRFAERHPDRPLVVVLTGTDLYRDIRDDADAQLSLRLATQLVVLQDQGPTELVPALRAKTRVIYQSAPARTALPPLKRAFEVCVMGHLREEKDPFRTALALVALPAASRIRVVQMGDALSPAMAEEAHRLMAREPRYRWLGERPHGEAMQRLRRGRLMVISSRMEGGANVICEAVQAGIPILASRIPGNVGMLGEDYGGYFPPGDERELARLLARAESDCAWLETLRRQCGARRPLFEPGHERESLRQLLEIALPRR